MDVTPCLGLSAGDCFGKYAHVISHTPWRDLGNVATHAALILLRYSLSSSKLLHILRCSPCAGHRGLERYDSIIRGSLCRTLSLSDVRSLAPDLAVHHSWWTGNSFGCLVCTSRLSASVAGTPSLQPTKLIRGTFLADQQYEASMLNSAPKQSYWGNLSSRQ